MRREKGFTLIELLVTLAIFSVMVAVVAPFSVLQLRRSRIKTESQSLVSSMRLTQQRGISGQNASKFGIKFNNNEYILYEGENYATASQRETYELNNNVSISNINLTGGATEIGFSSEDIRPNATGTLIMSDGNSSFRIIINAEGLIDYEEL